MSVVEQYNVFFDGNNLNDIEGVEIYNHNFNNLPSRTLRQNEIARADKSVITSADYTEKTVSIQAEVCSGNRTETENTITFLKSLLQRINAPVRVKQSESEYRYFATLNQFNIEWLGMKAIVDIGLIAADPIGYETQQTELLDETITVRQISYSRIIGGSFRAQPVFTLNINSITGGTNGQIQLRNNNTGQGITIHQDFEANDTLVINSSTRQATLNGSRIDFSGLFPTFAAGTRGIGYSDNFDARNIDITANYVKRII